MEVLALEEPELNGSGTRNRNGMYRNRTVPVPKCIHSESA